MGLQQRLSALFALEGKAAELALTARERRPASVPSARKTGAAA